MFFAGSGIWKGEGETYAPVVGAAVPEGAAAAPPAPPAGTLTGEPGVGGSLPDGELDPEPEPEPEPGEPEEPDWLPDGEPEPELEPELGEPVEPAAAVGVAVTVK